MPGTKKTDSAEMLANLAERVSANSKSWRTARAKQLARLKKNHFEHYAPDNIDEARADVRKAKAAGRTGVRSS